MKTCRLSVLLMLAVLVDARGGHAAPRQLPVLPIPQCFGVAVHVRASNVSAQTALIKKAGFGWVRTDLDWDDIEQLKGTYDFRSSDKIADTFHNAGLRTIFILDYGNRNYDAGLSPVSQEARSAFARFAAAAASRYANKGVIWEIYNEPNIESWKPAPDADQYIALAKAATQAIRRAVPEAIIVGPALSGPHSYQETLRDELGYLDKVLGSDVVREWSAITVHPYRAEEVPETASVELSVVRDLMRRHGVDPQRVPIASTEWGYSTWTKGVSEQMQAAYAVRTMLWGMADHMPFSVWYDLQDDGNEDSIDEHRGLIRSDEAKTPGKREIAKPAFVALAQMEKALRGYSSAEIVASNTSYILLSFTKNERRAFVLWSSDNTVRAIGLAFLPQGRWVSAHPLHSPAAITARPGREVLLQIDAMPTIITPYE